MAGYQGMGYPSRGRILPEYGMQRPSSTGSIRGGWGMTTTMPRPRIGFSSRLPGSQQLLESMGRGMRSTADTSWSNRYTNFDSPVEDPLSENYVGGYNDEPRRPIQNPDSNFANYYGMDTSRQRSRPVPYPSRGTIGGWRGGGRMNTRGEEWPPEEEEEEAEEEEEEEEDEFTLQKREWYRLQNAERRRVPFPKKDDDIELVPEDPDEDEAVQRLLRGDVDKPKIDIPKELLGSRHCHICDTQLTSDLQADAHYQGKTHKKKARQYLEKQQLKNGMIPIIPKDLAVSKESKDSDITFCDYCSMAFTSDIQARQHFEGRNHKKKVDQATKPQPPPSEPKKPKRSGLGFSSAPGHMYCDVCDVSVTSGQQFEMHIQGQKHLNKLKKLGEDLRIMEDNRNMWMY